MSKGIQSARRALHPATVGAKLGDPASKGLKRFDAKLEKKGFFPESRHLQKKQKQKERGEEIALRQQQETARVEEAESEIARKRFLAKAGGRRSLIASR